MALAVRLRRPAYTYSNYSHGYTYGYPAISCPMIPAGPSTALTKYRLPVEGTPLALVLRVQLSELVMEWADESGGARSGNGKGDERGRSRARGEIRFRTPLSPNMSSMFGGGNGDMQGPGSELKKKKKKKHSASLERQHTFLEDRTLAKDCTLILNDEEALLPTAQELADHELGKPKNELLVMLVRAKVSLGAREQRAKHATTRHVSSVPHHLTAILR